MAFARILLMLLAVTVSARAVVPEASTDLVVAGHQWGKIVSKTVITERGTYTLDPDIRLPHRRPGTAPWTIIFRRETYMLVRNEGSRTVKTVRWTYVFYSDPKHEHEVARFDFQSKANVKPGETKFLSEPVDKTAPTPYDDVVVQGVEYESDKR